MHPKVLLTFAVTIAIAVVVLLLQRAYLRSTLRKLGPGAEAVPLYRRPSIIAQRVLFGVALALPLIAIAIGVITPRPVDDILFEVVRSMWVGIAAWGWQQGSVVMAGPKGIALAGRIYPWSVVEIAFDRDIGQELWGITVSIRGQKGMRRRRLYAIRENRARMESVLRALRPVGQAASP